MCLLYSFQLHFVHQTLKYQAISDALEDPYGLAVLGVFAKVGADIHSCGATQTFHG